MIDLTTPKIPPPYIKPKPQGTMPNIFVQNSFLRNDKWLWFFLLPGRWSRSLCLNIIQTN